MVSKVHCRLMLLLSACCLWNRMKNSQILVECHACLLPAMMTMDEPKIVSKHLIKSLLLLELPRPCWLFAVRLCKEAQHILCCPKVNFSGTVPWFVVGKWVVVALQSFLGGILARTEAGAGTVTNNSTVPCQLAHKYRLVVLVMPGKLSITVHTGVSALLLMSPQEDWVPGLYVDAAP